MGCGFTDLPDLTPILLGSGNACSRLQELVVLSEANGVEDWLAKTKAPALRVLQLAVMDNILALVLGEDDVAPRLTSLQVSTSHHELHRQSVLSSTKGSLLD